MPAGVRKAALAVHLSVSVGWIGAVVAYLALGIAAATTADEVIIRAAWVSMELTGWYAIVPLAIASVMTGLVMAVGTRWGLLRHYWVVISLVLTLVALVVLLLHMPTVSATADLARTASGDRLTALGGDIAHPAIGLALLLVVQVLNVYKPRGLTRRGQLARRKGRDSV